MQSKELHRILGVQKRLMEELEREKIQSDILTTTTELEISTPSHNLNEQMQQLQKRAAQALHGPDLQVHSLRQDYCSREMSGSCSGGGDTIKVPHRGFDLTRPANEVQDEGREAGPSSYTALQKRKSRNEGDDEDVEIDLTLSLGGSSSSQGKEKEKEKEKTNLLHSSASFKSDRGGECSDPNTPMSSSSVTFDQQRKGGTSTHWLPQDLRRK